MCTVHDNNMNAYLQNANAFCKVNFFYMQPTCERFSKTDTWCSYSKVSISTSVCPLLGSSPLIFDLLLATLWTVHLESGVGTSYLAITGCVGVTNSSL